MSEWDGLKEKDDEMEKKRDSAMLNNIMITHDPIQRKRHDEPSCGRLEWQTVVPHSSWLQMHQMKQLGLRKRQQYQYFEQRRIHSMRLEMERRHLLELEQASLRRPGQVQVSPRQLELELGSLQQLELGLRRLEQLLGLGSPRRLELVLELESLQRQGLLLELELGSLRQLALGLQWLEQLLERRMGRQLERILVQMFQQKRMSLRQQVLQWLVQLLERQHRQLEQQASLQRLLELEQVFPQRLELGLVSLRQLERLLELGLGLEFPRPQGRLPLLRLLLGQQWRYQHHHMARLELLKLLVQS